MMHTERYVSEKGQLIMVVGGGRFDREVTTVD